MINKAMSVTSNEVKLLKHMDSLQAIQDGKASPVLLHLSPTNKCQLNCGHCCFAGRDKSIELPFDKLRTALTNFAKIGIKSVELTGGGEPSLYSDISALTGFIADLGLPLGINTNAMSADRVDWSTFRWARVSLNVFDQPDLRHRFLSGLERIRKQLAKVTACYIIPQDYSAANLLAVIEFAEGAGLVTRLAPDCVQQRADIAKLLDRVRVDFGQRIASSSYVFLSDFNVYVGDRKDNQCWMHSLKPLLFTDGWVYSCPSSELSPENDRRMQDRFRVCRMEDILEYYARPMLPFDHDCHYCKYAVQNEFMSALMTEVDDEEFC